jgi:hypothetical protein
LVSHILGVIDDSPIKRYFLNFISSYIFFKKNRDKTDVWHAY